MRKITFQNKIRMVQIFAILKPLIKFLMKLAGMTPQLVETEPGTIIHVWVPTQTIISNKTTSNMYRKPNKPAVVFIHGFGLDGILTWLFQALILSRSYSVYVPDLVFFGGSVSDRKDRCTGFQAMCLAKAMGRLGVETCSVVGVSYGGLVAFKMAKLYPGLVERVVVSSSVIELTESTSKVSLKNVGFGSWMDLLLPQSVVGAKRVLWAATHGLNISLIPNFMYQDYVRVISTNRQKKVELLDKFVIDDTEASSPDQSQYLQKIFLLWGAEDKVFSIQLAKSLKEKLGDNASLESIKNAGHLVPIERPILYTKHLKTILSSTTLDH